MVMVRSFAFSLLVLFAIPSFGQTAERETVTQATEWFALNSNIKLHPRIGFAFDGQLRFVQNFESAQHYVRNGLEVYITPQLSIVPVGYMYVWNFLYGKQPARFQNHEQRIWQQVIYRHAYKRFNFQHRFRLEQRFVQSHNSETGEYEGYSNYLNRARYRLQVQIPLNNDKMGPEVWFATIFDEVFYSWGKNVTFHKPDQNRIYGAVGYQFTKDFNIQGGPFYQMLIKAGGTQQENNVGVLIQFTYHFDFSKQP